MGLKDSSEFVSCFGGGGRWLVGWLVGFVLFSPQHLPLEWEPLRLAMHPPPRHCFALEDSFHRRLTGWPLLAWLWCPRVPFVCITAEPRKKQNGGETKPLEGRGGRVNRGVARTMKMWLRCSSWRDRKRHLSWLLQERRWHPGTGSPEWS